VAERWRLDYNHHRPHSALNWMTPAAFAASCPSAVDGHSGWTMVFTHEQSAGLGPYFAEADDTQRR
jgi:hypothetical protein